jgi:hypothetical protein
MRSANIDCLFLGAHLLLICNCSCGADRGAAAAAAAAAFVAAQGSVIMTVLTYLLGGGNSFSSGGPGKGMHRCVHGIYMSSLCMSMTEYGTVSSAAMLPGGILTIFQQYNISIQ